MESYETLTAITAGSAPICWAIPAGTPATTPPSISRYFPYSAGLKPGGDGGTKCRFEAPLFKDNLSTSGQEVGGHHLNREVELLQPLLII